VVGHIVPGWRLLLFVALRRASPFDGRNRLRLGRALAALTLASALLPGLAAAHRAGPVPPVRTIPLPGQRPLIGLAAAPALGRVFVTDDGGVVWVLDAAGRLLGAADVTTDGDLAYPTASIAVDEARHRVYVPTISTATAGPPGGLALLDVNNGALAAHQTGAVTVAVALDGATGRVLLAEQAPAALVVLDADHQTVMATIALAWPPAALAVDETARRVYLAEAGTARLLVLDADTYRTLAVVTVGAVVGALVVDAATHRVYVADPIGGVLAVLDGPRAAILATIPAGRAPAALALNPATSHLFVAAEGAVTVVDTRREAVVATLPAGPRPVGVAADPRTGRVYVADGNEHTVAILRDRPGDLAWPARPAAAPINAIGPPDCPHRSGIADGDAACE
jgi:DNA-binding beta-propeller fold protein YncE